MGKIQYWNTRLKQCASLNMEFAYSKRNFVRLQGIACIFVILHHLSDHIERLWFFQYIGYLPVGFFLFCSGYGLTFSLRNKDKYLKQLILIRIPTVLIDYMVANLIYLCVRLAMGMLNCGSLFHFLFGGGALVTYSWYIICIVYLYAAFWLSHSLLRNHSKLAGVAVVLAVVLWSVVMLCSGGGVHRYNAVICFLGGYLAGNNDRFKKMLIGWKICMAAAVIFLLSFLIASYGSIKRFPIYVRFPFMELAVCSFVLLILNIGCFMRQERSLFDGLGYISLEFYMYQGCLMLLLRNSAVKITSDFMYGVMVFLGSILLGLLMHHVDGRVKTLLKKTVKI